MEENPPICIEPMEPEHFAALSALEKLCFSDPWPPDAFREEFENELAAFFVALRGGRVVGYAGMTFVLDEGYICNIAVHPGSRRSGVAAALLARLDEFAKEKRLRFLTLEVRVSNRAAISVYEKGGFENKGVRAGFYAKPREDAFIMTKYFETQRP